MAGGDPLLDSTPGAGFPAPEDTFGLLERARAGDRDAANRIFARYEERIRRIVRVRLGPRLRRWTESGDIVQETCRSAFEGLGALRLDGEFDLLDWLARVATHRIRDFVDHVQAEKRDLGRALPLATGASELSDADGSPADPRSGPGETAFRAEVRALLDEVVAGLPENQREVVLLRDYHGADWPQVASRLGLPTAHAAQQLHQRAWIRVRDEAAPRLAGLKRRG